MSLADYYDYLDIDCEDCGVKFYINPANYIDREDEIPTRCWKCRAAFARIQQQQLDNQS